MDEGVELAKAAARRTAVHASGGEIRDPEPYRNNGYRRGTQVPSARANAQDRSHPAAAHPTADAAVHGADELIHVFLNRDARLPAAHRHGDLQITPDRRPTGRDPRKRPTELAHLPRVAKH